MTDYMIESLLNLLVGTLIIVGLALVPYLTVDMSFVSAMKSTLELWLIPLLGFFTYALLVNPLVEAFKKKWLKSNEDDDSIQ